MKFRTITAIVTVIAWSTVAAAAVTGATIITEGAVRSIDGFPFDNTSFDPYLLAATDATVYFASVNVTTTYLDTQVFAFPIDADETATAAVEVVNDLSLKSLYNATGSFWFASAGDVAGGFLYLITAEDGDGDDGEYIEPSDIDRVVRVDLASGEVRNVVAALGADGVVGLTELDGMLYLLTSTHYGAVENGVMSVTSDATDGFLTPVVGETQITAVTGGTTPRLCCIDTTESGALLFADNESGQVLQVGGLEDWPVVSVLTDAATLGATPLGEVEITGLGTLPDGGFLLSDVKESADLADDRGILAFAADGRFGHVVAVESEIVALIPADDHLAFTPNNEVRITASGRIVVCETDNPESIFWLEDQALLSLFSDGFESGDTSAWGRDTE